MAGLHVVFSGQVQGVGFRWTVRQACNQERVTGWVRNLRNGDVEAELFGEEHHLARALDRIEQARSGYIREVRKAPIDAAPPPTFEIRR